MGVAKPAGSCRGVHGPGGTNWSPAVTDTTAGPTSVRRGDEARHYKDVETFADKRYRAARRGNWLLLGCCAVLLASNLALSFDEARHEPTRIQPVFFGVMEDGSIDTHLTVQDMAESQRENVLKDMAWTYVRACEEYSYAHAQQNFDLCKAMSDDPVREAFIAKWFLPNGKNAPDSPQKQFGQDGQIDLQQITRPAFVRDHVIQVRFKRIYWHYKEPYPPSWQCKAPERPGALVNGDCTTWTATVDFTLLDKMPNGPVVGDSIKFFVTRYQVGEGAI
jgi:type IV secretory pathway component VirB8